ncbi:iron complex transport system substrate-binding protein [Cytobacillus oceanisediminis]|jgi:iron complex transport system substrate-binding protein|uniref:Iron complex transport system substrate-binding protein n=1 Tax=Cytobacillus oceanisediminis TaxID=665099 RepID=A0A2V2ZJB6_9BACI|nr:siderophore ABC transporter substrate-binding protein [Cytobacillus oceanisediminis]PWW20045.1 iron complex transport system substrate-binding protein [Cytobacillus oceanisediminis]
MARKLSLFLIMAVLAIVTAACGTETSQEANGSDKDSKTESNEITIEHQLGETPVKVNPEKVIVFDFGVLDTLDKLGVEVTGVPQVNIPQYLSKFEDSKYENVGSLKEPDFEKISEIEPELIIISGRQQEAYEELSEIAPTIFMGVDTSKYMQSFKENTKTLGEVFGKEEEAEKELASIEESIAALKEKATADGSNGLIILANEGSLSAYGSASRFGIIHDVFGIKPADDKIEVSTHGQSVSSEYIVEKDPDYLFVIDRGAAVEGESSAKQIIENELVKKTKAYKNDHIVYLNPDYWYLSGGGLVSVAEMVKEIEKGLE